ncbi:TonB-dependent receptor [Paraglaciecola arctica]|uniref:Oar protein n=1 Tax=Paraglaciecola arctica BSs20135 TaxID=493475 RepID=K6Y001_9ALTE|nr:TonB-dependent receptor [Paraglaciecola arctica]GAC17226.1 Oar protein [Paraglaciecola arctica BSs20135]
MFTFKKSVTALAIAASLGLAMPAMAGNNDGNIAGTVVDARTQQSVSGAEVILKNIATGYTKSLTTSANGSYRLGNLPVGTYNVSLQVAGYEPVSQGDITVSIGATTNVDLNLVAEGDNIEKIEVHGSAFSMVDVTSSESALNIGAVELSRIPVPRNLTSVALLAPGVTQGDARFGNYASFGGASVAENSVYINGLNVTNFRNGLGFSNVPFEFYDQFQVKTGGYSAEFGRSTGGVVNAVTKRGSNEFKFGANVYWQPADLREQSPNSKKTNGEYYIYNGDDERSEMQGNIYASGAIIQDTLFFYAIYNPRDISNDYTNGEKTTYNEATGDDAFWGGKIDWQISENHLLELLAFSDSATTSTDNFLYEPRTYNSTSFEETGGDNWSLKYTGYITDDFTVSALYGENEYTLTTKSNIQNDCELFYDTRDVQELGFTSSGCATSNDYIVEDGNDKREAMRIDFGYILGDHEIRFGFDSETNTSGSVQAYSGPDGKYWFLYDGTPGATLSNGAVIPEGVTQYSRSRLRTVSGNFETEATAMYIEDTWTVTDNLTIKLGVRNETFDNKNGEGETFAKIDNMIAPRFGLAWDPTGEGDSKVFVNIGRYFLPVANNTNVRLSGNEYDVYQFFELEGVNVNDYNGIPYLTAINGAQIGADQFNADGSVPDVSGIVDQDLDPMYQDEFMLGYQAVIGEGWSWGVKGIRRELNGAIDDMTISHVTQAKYGCDHPGGGGYVLGNPGEDMTIKADTDCDHEVDTFVTLTGEELGYPTATRTYNALEFTLDRQWDDVWSMSASYTWSKSYGNSEGLVKSDNAQEDAGLTQDFDFPDLMDGAYGNLPNDKRHQFKVYGSYSLTDNLLIGANFSLQSGRPITALGIGHPNGIPDYGDTYYLCTADCATDDPTYAFSPRGTFGETPWIARLDLSASYTMEFADSYEVNFRADIFNVLDAHSTTRVNEIAELGEIGQAEPDFGLTSGYQTPRYVQFSASIRF